MSDKLNEVKDLMRPRWRVIADYFFSPYKVGDIITLSDNKTIHLTTTQHRDEFGENIKQANYYEAITIERFPHLFKKLEWFEERKIEEMPEYVKVNGVGCSFPTGDILESFGWGVFPDEGRNLGNENVPFAVIEVKEDMKLYKKGERIRMSAKNIEPASLTDYNIFLTTK